MPLIQSFMSDRMGVAQKAAFFALSNEDRPHHTGIEARIADIVEPRLAAMGYELVRIALLGRERPTLQIMADRADGGLIAVEDCEVISHQIGAVLDVEDIVPGAAWTLEVSSAGIDRPLTRVRDWNRFAGHLAKVELMFPGPGGRKRFTGAIISADDTEATIKTDTGDVLALKLADVKKARLLL